MISKLETEHRNNDIMLGLHAWVQRLDFAEKIPIRPETDQDVTRTDNPTPAALSTGIGRDAALPAQRHGRGSEGLRAKIVPHLCAAN